MQNKMEDNIINYKIKLKHNVTGEQVANIIFKDKYKKTQTGWFNGSSPLGKAIDPKTNQPYYKNGDANPSFGFIINDNWLNANSFVGANCVEAEKKLIMDRLKDYGFIDKRVKDKVKKNNLKHFKAFRTPSSAITQDITSKLDNQKMFTYMANCDCWRLVDDLDIYKTDKEKNKHKKPITINGEWTERTSYKQVQEMLKNLNQYKFDHKVSTRLLSFENFGTEYPIVCLDWDNHTEEAPQMQTISKIFIPKDYGINGDDVEFFGIEFSQSKTGYHIWIKLKSLEAWQRVIPMDDKAKKAKNLPFECFTNYQSKRQILTTATISNEAFSKNILVCDKLEVETEIKGKSLVFPEMSAEEMATKSHDTVGFNQRLAFYCGKDICWFNSKQGMKLYVYQDGKWILDEQLSYIRELMSKVTIKLLEELDYLQDEDEKEDLIKFYKQAQKTSFKRDCIEQLTDNSTNLKVPDDTFERNTGVNKVNVLNGTIVLDPIAKSYHFKKHSREDYLTVLNRNIYYDPSQECPKWKQFLCDIFLNDADLINYYQKALGYALAGDPKERIVIIQNGMGSNGKSVSAEIARYVFGEYAFSANKDMIILNKFRNGSNNTNLYHVLEKNIRLVTMSEIATSDVIDDSMFKNFTGGDDKQTCGTKYKEDIEKKTQATLFMQTNNLPKIKDTSSAIWNRIKIIPHNRIFEADEINIHLSDELKEEAQGIFNWILDGWLAYVQEGLTDTQEMKKLVKEYQSDEDIIQAWLDENTIQAKGSKLKVTEAYRDYSHFCKNIGDLSEISKRKFASLVEKKGIEKKTSSKSSLNSFLDITLKVNGFDELSLEATELKAI